MRILGLSLMMSVVLARDAGAGVMCGAQPAGPLIRVRSSGDATVTKLLRDALERSATFRQLVATIGHTNGLVYVDPGKCKPGFAACLVMSIQIAGPNRLLHVVVDTSRKPPEVIGSIGHELQHAIEALSEQGVTNNALLQAFFGRLAGTPAATGQLEFETDAAVRAGDAVSEEIRTFDRQH